MSVNFAVYHKFQSHWPTINSFYSILHCSKIFPPCQYTDIKIKSNPKLKAIHHVPIMTTSIWPLRVQHATYWLILKTRVAVKTTHKNMFYINGWVNNGEAGDLRRHRAHYDVIVMWVDTSWWCHFRHISFWYPEMFVCFKVPRNLNYSNW